MRNNMNQWTEIRRKVLVEGRGRPLLLDNLFSGVSQFSGLPPSGLPGLLAAVTAHDAECDLLESAE